MAKVLGDLMAPNGQYIKDGEEKTRWLKCGILLETDKGMRAKLEVLPVGIPEGGLWLSVFEKDNDQPRQEKPSTSQPAAPDGQEPMPF